MANIKSLQMWNDICADARVCISKSWFGLKTVVKCASTGSVIEPKKVQLDQQDGDRLQRILRTSSENLTQAVENFHLKESYNGRYILESCVSKDGMYVAMLLLQFKNFDYEPVTDVVVYEGENAKIISQIF
ncbi:MAG: hypothetical protein J6S89_10805 [Paludibacteraceae bacterium]|nr:hypothetical protein [Paludibacteraceae bacterium]